ncbi:hypothetical protein PIB30_066121 [Stylosanthes scabra]|uniref:Uncharacterized protein n=1 Tax=Stylosanthes scabra TaxID=79078 RepID=A0ABU6WQ24_9FABA|nr:hypothetical protein [Stylosanthes scabra]
MRGIKNTPKNSLNYLKATIDPNDVTARSRGGDRAGARSALTPGVTADRAVVRVRRAVAWPGQNPPKWLPGDRAIAQ